MGHPYGPPAMLGLIAGSAMLGAALATALNDRYPGRADGWWGRGWRWQPGAKLSNTRPQ
jgi:hypothetical protein